MALYREAHDMLIPKELGEVALRYDKVQVYAC
ncbi:hypothetical protein CHKEEEPN_3593 [Methylorubrum podarium]|nr:hypothetical protein CHKEEEPN_3593 [Methylorubrum podarium]